MLDRIYIEISNICNVQCTFCPVVERDKNIMSLLDFEKIIIQAKPLAQEVCLHLMGEPLAHPKFREILLICEKHEVKIQLTTNGILLNKYRTLLLESRVLRQINFSLQAFTDNFPNKKIDTYLTPILMFCELAQELKPDLYVNLRLWNQKSEDCDNSQILNSIESFFQISINRNVEVGRIKSKKIWNNTYLHFDSRFEWPSTDIKYQGNQGRCNGMINHIGIHANGEVVPCCLDKEAKIKLGNCLEKPLDEILASERSQAMINGFKNGKLVEKLCQHCSYINRFKKSKNQIHSL